MTSGNRLDIADDILLETVKCPVCLQIPIPPITLCKTGHFICGICRDKVHKCEICSAEFISARNIAIENLAAKLEIKCKHVLCSERSKVAELQEHMSGCEYRPIICKNTRGTPGCQKTVVKWEKYIRHLTEAHKVPLQILAAGWSPILKLSLAATDNLDEREKSPHIGGSVAVMDHDGEKFLFNMVQEYSVVFLWVNALVTDSQASEYWADIHIGNDENLKSKKTVGKVTWTLHISSVHKNLDDLKYTDYCAAIPLRSLVSFSKQLESGGRMICSQVTLHHRDKP